MSAAAPDAPHDPVVHTNAAIGETVVVHPRRPGTTSTTSRCRSCRPRSPACCCRCSREQGKHSR